MSFKTVKVGEYVVKEPTVGIMMPLLDKMAEDPKGFQLELAKACVTLHETPIGDGLNNLPMSLYIQLQEAVMEVAGFGSK